MANKKPSFKNKVPKSNVEKFVHIPNKILPDISNFEKENSNSYLGEWLQSTNRVIPKVECVPSGCPFTYFVFTNSVPIDCPKCGKTVRANYITY